MTSLSSIEAEASNLVGHLPEHRRRSLQQALADLSQTHWQELRGAEPTTQFPRLLWETTPPLADLCADLYAMRDARLDEVLQGRKPAQAFALLALEAIERGDAEGAHLAYQPMMLLEIPAAGAEYAERVAAMLRGQVAPPHFHRHESMPPLMKALRLMVAHSGRYDTPALVQVLRVLVGPGTHGEEFERLKRALEEVGMCFTAMDDERVHFNLHGQVHKPATLRQLSEMLGEIRGHCLA